MDTNKRILFDNELVIRQVAIWHHMELPSADRQGFHESLYSREMWILITFENTENIDIAV